MNKESYELMTSFAYKMVKALLMLQEMYEMNVQNMAYMWWNVFLTEIPLFRQAKHLIFLLIIFKLLGSSGLLKKPVLYQ